MRIKYEFCTEDVEIEVSDYWAAVLLELDKEEKNYNRKENRRRRDSFNLVSTCLSSDEIEDIVIEAMEAERLHIAIGRLAPRHRYLIQEVYINQRSFTEIAKEKGVQVSSVMRSTRYALKKLKTICELMQF